MKPARQQKKFVFKRSEPDLPEELTPTSDVAALFQPDDISISDSLLQEGRLENRKATTLHIESCVLKNIVLANNTFGAIVCKDVQFIDCDLANLETRGLTLVRVEFINCRMTGLRGGDADCQDLLIREGDQRYSQFRFSQFKSAEFDSCNFADADFHGTDLSGAIFRRCNLRAADMHEVKLVNADLRGSMVEGVELTAQDIRGAIVDPAQAMIFATLLGIRIE